MPTHPLPYLLLFRDSAPETYKGMSAEQRQHVLERWNEWYDQLAACGKLQYGYPLEPEGRVVVRAPGESATDGPFVESKDAIAGYFFLTVGNLEEATEIAGRCPSLEYGMVVEVRPVAECCHLGATDGPRHDRKLVGVEP